MRLLLWFTVLLLSAFAIWLLPAETRGVLFAGGSKALALICQWVHGELLADLQHRVTGLIAFVVAYISVANLWTLPRPRHQSTSKASVTADAASDDVDKPKTTDSDDKVGSQFKSNLGRTIISGASGFATTAALEKLTSPTLGQRDDLTLLYVFWFLFFFVVLLVVAALWTAHLEKTRVRVIVLRRRRSLTRAANANLGRGNVLLSWLSHRGRTANEVDPIEELPLVWGDTFTGFLRGHGQQMTEAISDEVEALEKQNHDSFAQLAASLRENIQDVLISELSKAPNSTASKDDVRVSISLLHRDNQRVYYVSAGRNSLHRREFEPRSVAWLCARARIVRWVRMGDNNPADGENVLVTSDELGRLETEVRNAVLRAIGRESKADLNTPVKVKDFWQERARQDYGAFIVFPAPYSRAAQGRIHRTALIHIAFARAEDLTTIFPGTQPNADAEYSSARRLLDRPTMPSQPGHSPTNESVRVVLRTALAALEASIDQLEDYYLREGPTHRRTEPRGVAAGSSSQ